MEKIERILNFRERVKSFVEKQNLILRFLAKFIGAVIMIRCLNELMGYSAFLRQPSVIGATAIICLLIPFSYSYIMFSLLCIVQLLNVSVDITLLMAAGLIMFYVIYNRNCMRYGYLAILTVILLPTNLSALVPIFVGIFSGPLGIPPMLMGIVIYFFSSSLDRAILEMTRTVNTQPLYQMVLDMMISDKEMLLYTCCFVITALVAAKMYRMQADYAWMVSIPTVGIIYTVIYLYGSFLLEIESSIPDSILTFFLSVILLEVIQFFRNIIDYSRAENLQFEDDEYYYYVKAVPKINIPKRDVNVMKINARRKNWFIRRRDKKE